MESRNPKIVFFGAGAVGGSVGAWVASRYDNTAFLDQGPIADAIRERGITTYCADEPEKKENVRVKVIGGLKEAASADVIAVAVKNYSLDAVAKAIRAEAGDKPVIVAMQNGAENQKVLPRYFTKVIYCVIGYNAWLDEPGVVGYQKKGPLVFGTPDNSLQEEMRILAEIFNRGVETVIVDHLQDAVHSKLIINLANSLTTLVGHKFRPISDMALFQKLLSSLLLEGVRIARAAGYHECKIGGMPPWRTIWMVAKLPRLITGGMFDKNADRMVMSSMAQDIIQRPAAALARPVARGTATSPSRGPDSELETINGYFLALAERYGMDVPYNRAVYELCRREFAKPRFEPMDVREVWEQVAEKKSR